METKTNNKINEWLRGDYDEATKNEIRRLQKEDEQILKILFIKIWNLEPADLEA